MANKDQTPSQLYDLLVTQDFEPEVLDSMGKPVTNPQNGELFSFDFKINGTNYGSVVILLDSENNLEIYSGDNIAKGMESDDRSEWFEFLKQLRYFAKRRLLTFTLKPINRLKYTMQGIAALKEGLFEGYYGTRKISYSDQPMKTRLIIKHNRDLAEGEARFRNIESLFVETEDGSRFRLPFKKLIGGRMMARHCAEGGTPYDTFGQHIAQIVEEMNTLSRFIRAAKHKQFTNDAVDLLEQAIRHYQDLKAKAKTMISQRGYRLVRESFNPVEFRDVEVAAEAIRDMFIEQSLDHRIEEAVPLLARLALSQREMKEANEFERWANNVTDGTRTAPATPEAQEKLQDLLANVLTVGPDAINAIGQLHDIFGDDILFDQLYDLADQNPDADARPLVLARLKQLDMFSDQESDKSDSVDMKEPNSDASIRRGYNPVRNERVKTAAT